MSAHYAVANGLWTGINVAGYHRFRAALHDPEKIQEAILSRYLRRNAETAFGRDHSFDAIRSSRAYRERVPVAGYDDYTPYIDRIAEGQTGVLTRAPVKLFALSSGSTRAAKWIPYTGALQSEFRRGVAPWIVDLMASRPKLLGGPAYWSISPALSPRRARHSVIPVGFDEDSASLGGVFKRLVDLALPVPGGISGIQDIELFRRLTLLYLLRVPELRLISIWHPSFLEFLLAPLTAQWESLVSDIARGMRIPESTLRCPADPVRARALAKLDPERPDRIWPNLALISCWGSAHAADRLHGIRRLFPDVEVQAKGLIATEAFASLPFGAHYPLAVTSHFFEFLDHDGLAHPAWDVRQGAVYSLVVTTGGGLYRYRLGDLVEVTGFLGKTPCLRFLGKEDRVSDLCGEKLSEGFVAAALRAVLGASGMKTEFCMLAPDRKNGVSRYLLFLESPEAPPRSLGADLDRRLRENPHYDYCVRIGQLAPIEVLRVRANAYERYVRRLRARGQRLGDIKPSPLSALSGWRQALAQEAEYEDACAH